MEATTNQLAFVHPSRPGAFGWNAVHPHARISHMPSAGERVSVCTRLGGDMGDDWTYDAFWQTTTPFRRGVGPREITGEVTLRLVSPTHGAIDVKAYVEGF